MRNALYDKLYELKREIHQGVPAARVRELLLPLAQEAQEYYLECGEPQVFSEELLENRGVDPSDPKFFEHVHVIEALLASG